LSDFKTAFLSAFLLGLIDFWVSRCWLDYFLSVSTVEEPQRRLRLAKKNAQNFFAFLYYVCVTIFGTWVLQQSRFMPWYFFKAGNERL